MAAGPASPFWRQHVAILIVIVHDALLLYMLTLLVSPHCGRARLAIFPKPARHFGGKRY